MTKKKYPVVTLCGSTKFKEHFLETAKKLSLDGYIVLTPLVFSQADNITLTEDELQLLKEAHNRKLNMSDMIYVINPNGYIGKGTYEEIAYANSLGLEIIYLE